jgi:hypothetical protein
MGRGAVLVFSVSRSLLIAILLESALPALGVAQTGDGRVDVRQTGSKGFVLCSSPRSRIRCVSQER